MRGRLRILLNSSTCTDECRPSSPNNLRRNMHDLEAL